MNIKEVLKKYYGYDSFRQGQEYIINSILEEKDFLAIMPTAAGKSICYQIPAIILEGTSIVISPLISLMKDQVDNLKQIGIDVAYINSTLSLSEYNKVISNIKVGNYKIIYVTPERFVSENFMSYFDNVNIPMIAIDEAHCVSQWGHDFRPSYVNISKVINSMKKRPIITAFTATATDRVKEDIITLLDLKDPLTITTGFDRKNLKFTIESPTNKFEYLDNYLKNCMNEPVVIYCSTRKEVDNIYEKLVKKGFLVSKYHAGMNETDKNKSQDDFINDNTQIIVATNAFGMGIDKSNIRFVIHYNMPSSMEAYYQEAGRAGRDGVNSECILLFSKKDIVTQKFLINRGESNNLANSVDEYAKLQHIIDYCNIDTCLRKYILKYFGETVEYENCNNCSTCTNSNIETDVTKEAQKILSCIARLNFKYGSNMIIDILKGSSNIKIKNLGLDKISTYGIMKEVNRNTIKDIIFYLNAKELIKSIGDEYPVIGITPKSKEVLFNSKSVIIKRKLETKLDNKQSINNKKEILDNIDMKLFEILKILRKDIATSNNIPPFIVFSDNTLLEMSSKYPISELEMLNISGVGQNKLEKYGEQFILKIKEYIKENNLEDKLKEIRKDLNLTNNNSNDMVSKKQDSSVNSNTYEETFKLYKMGKSIDEIVNLRKLSKNTIEGHYIKLYKNGEDIKFDIDETKENLIKNAIKKVGIQKLKPIKELLPDSISYFDIKYYIAKYC